MDFKTLKIKLERKLRKLLKLPAKNGFIYVEPKIEDWQLSLGGLQGREQIMPVIGGWKNYLPVKEMQNRGSETMACVTFSALNCLEIYLKWLIKNKPEDVVVKTLDAMGYIKDGECNFSDRFTAKMSGTTQSGNGQDRVADAIRNYGLIPETDYPYVDGWGEYYKQIPLELIQKGRRFAETFDITHEWINPADFNEGLKYRPIQTAVYAWNGRNDKGYYTRVENNLNHAIIHENYVKNEYMELWDSYETVEKKVVWNFKVGYGKIFDIKLKKNFNQVLIDALRKDGVQLIMRPESLGEIYELTEDGLKFLDSNKDEITRHVPLFDYFVIKASHNLPVKLLPVSEEKWKQISS